MWHSYVINLEQNRARRENSRRQFAEQGVAFSVINAVNGRELDEETVARVYDAGAARRRFKHELTRPEIGCYLSHLAAWTEIVKSGAGGGFVFEDDFEVVSPLAPILAKLTELAGSGGARWDVVKLFSLKPKPRIVDSAPLIDGYQLVVPYQVPTCLLGYGIRRATAEKLLATALPFFRPVDEDMKFFWEKGIAVSLVSPSPVQVGDQQTVTGTIGDSRKTSHRATLGRRLVRSWKGLTYQLRYKALLHYHRGFGLKS